MPSPLGHPKSETHARAEAALPALSISIRGAPPELADASFHVAPTVSTLARQTLLFPVPSAL